MFGLPVGISPEDAIAIAQAAAAERTIDFRPPYAVSSGIWSHHIMSRADGIGGNVFAVVRRRDGKLVSMAGPTPR